MIATCLCCRINPGEGLQINDHFAVYVEGALNTNQCHWCYEKNYDRVQRVIADRLMPDHGRPNTLDYRDEMDYEFNGRYAR